MSKPDIIRNSDWEERLANKLEQKRDVPFKWGSNDCALFAADCVLSMTGVDPAEAFRGLYDTKTGAAQALRDHGQGTLLKTVRHWFGEEKHVALAQRGDLVMQGSTALGVCVGQYSYFPGTEQNGLVEGLVFVPTAGCSRAFSVPFDKSEATNG